MKSRIREIARARVSYGYRRVHVLLRREGWPINVKRVLRLYREEGLCLREFTSRALDHWAYRNSVKLDYIRPGRPTENGFIEGFSAAVRRECLSQHYFSNVVDARCELNAWREEYNNARPHSALGQLPPAQYRGQVESTGDRKKLALRRA